MKKQVTYDQSRMYRKLDQKKKKERMYRKNDYSQISIGCDTNELKNCFVIKKMSHIKKKKKNDKA